MSTTEKNRFSQLLEQLILMSEVKNTSLAKALQYDASYISKWINGRILPTEKTKRKVLTGISHELVRQSTRTGMGNLCANYQVIEPEELETVIYDHLEAEYDYVTELQKTYGSSIAPKTNFFIELSPAEYIARMHHPVLRRVKLLDVMAEMDLLSLLHEYRLQIIQGDMRREAYRAYPDVHFSLVLDLCPEKTDPVYDPVFLLNMMSDMSRVDFHLYKGKQAAGRMIFSVKDEFMISGMLMDANRCMSVTTSTEPSNCNVMYYNIRDLCTRENLLYRETTMKQMITENNYIHSVLSLNQKWILGHMTEHFLSDELFEELLGQLGKQQNFHMDETRIRYLHALTKKALEETRFDILIYSAAFSNFAIDSELDFFDHKMHLNVQQRESYIKNLLQLCTERKNLRIKVIYGKLTSDFHYHVTQCVFLSDRISYVRLNTENQDNNLVVLNHPDMQMIFTRFFSGLWDEKEASVLSNPEEINSFICNMIQRLNVISGI